VRMATEWLVAKITASSWQLLEYKRINPIGLYNQAWQDSSVSYLHVNGDVANADAGIAAIEIQAYAYDALRAAADMVAADETEADAWRHMASLVRDTTFDRLWMPHQKFFAMGLDRSDNGDTRQIATLNSNAGLLLGTRLFDSLPHHLSWPYVEGIVHNLFSDEFMTPVGPRLRARKHADLVSFADYHGSLVSWPKQTFDIAQGLRKHGFYRLAALLEDCILQAVHKAGEFYEFFFVDKTGAVKYHYRQEQSDEPAFHDFGAANLPEPGQAWTVSAVLAIVAARHNPAQVLPGHDVVHQLETEILERPHVAALVKHATSLVGMRAKAARTP